MLVYKRLVGFSAHRLYIRARINLRKQVADGICEVGATTDGLMHGCIEAALNHDLSQQPNQLWLQAGARLCFRMGYGVGIQDKDKEGKLSAEAKYRRRAR